MIEREGQKREKRLREVRERDIEERDMIEKEGQRENEKERWIYYIEERGKRELYPVCLCVHVHVQIRVFLIIHWFLQLLLIDCSFRRHCSFKVSCFTYYYVGISFEKGQLTTNTNKLWQLFMIKSILDYYQIILKLTVVTTIT